LIEYFRSLFKKKDTRPIDDVRTKPLSEEQLKNVTVTQVVYKPPQLMIGSGQSIGKQRDHNEDTLFTLAATLSDGTMELPFGIFIVADGMGGHLHGEIASGVATRSVAEYIIKKLYSSLLGLQQDSHNESLQEIMENGIKEAQQIVVRKAPGGGTTLTAALVIGEQVTLAHVGDTRAYFIYTDGRIQSMTQDHSLVRRLVELGQLSEQDAASSNQRNVLYRAIGQLEPFRPDISTFLFPKPGYMLICSDGLWGVVSDIEIFRVVTSSANLSLACHRLVELANAGGGPDNISVVLVQYLN
jgi:serine/threonine protein phosphatase PrpC